VFAALDMAAATVISALHRRHRTFLITINTAVSAKLDVHIICDNYATHTTDIIQKRLAAHPGSICMSSHQLVLPPDPRRTSVALHQSTSRAGGTSAGTASARGNTAVTA